MKHLSFPLIALSIILTGCATTTETNPARVSAGDLWYGSERLEAYLESRRKELGDMQAHASSLGTKLELRKDELVRLDTALRGEQAKTGQVDRKRQLLEQEVQQKLAELNKKEQEVQKLKSELAQLESDLHKAQDKRAVNTQMAEFEVEIEDMEAEIAVLERSIDRILVVRAKHALETE